LRWPGGRGWYAELRQFADVPPNGSMGPQTLIFAVSSGSRGEWIMLGCMSLEIPKPKSA
jgi:hypothetical protein